MIALEETEDAWRVVLQDAEVGQVSLGYELGLVVHTQEQETLHVTIATPFRVRHDDEPWRDIDPARDDPELGGLIIMLRHRALLECVAHKAGTLLLQVANQLTVEVPSHPRYEAWDIDAKRFKLVAIPGDELAVWHR
jgi:hypothetical protein